jgi:hypothetical protein
MKVTSNLSFLLCISSVVMPAIDARASGFGRKLSASMQRQEIFDVAAHQESHRDLKSPVTENSSNVRQQLRSLQTDGGLGVGLCEAFIEILLGPDSGCLCGDDGEVTSECEEFLSGCDICDTLQGEEACLAFDDAKSTAASSVDADVEAYCETYESGPFVGSTQCAIDNLADNTCTITIDGAECNSCSIVTCSFTDGAGVLDESYDMDCSNIIQGETWNLCTDDIPETSRFLVSGNNERFAAFDCRNAGGGGGSGGLALSFRALSVVGLIVVATFW